MIIYFAKNTPLSERRGGEYLTIAAPAQVSDALFSQHLTRSENQK
jgi:hypothetical protein